MFKIDDILKKLIIANVAVFLIVNIIIIFAKLTSNAGLMVDVWDYMAIPALVSKLSIRWWTPFSYMFTHVDFWHLVGNMLWLFFLGQMFLQKANRKQLFALYIVGGLAGALFFVVFFNCFSFFERYKELAVAIGASASVTAIVIATAILSPRHKVYIFGIIGVELRWLAVFYVVYDLLSITGQNAGGHIAHLGGAAFGAIYGYYFKNGTDILKPINNLFDNFKSTFESVEVIEPKPKMKVHRNQDYYEDISENKNNYTQYKSNFEHTSSKEQTDEERINKILEKISKEGYDGLTNEEKEFLNKFKR